MRARKHTVWICVSSLGALMVAALAAWRFCPPAQSDAALTRQAYVWQRAWTPAVVSAVGDDSHDFDRLVPLAAEVSFDAGRLRIVRPDINYAALARSRCSVGLAVRINPYAGTFATDDDTAEQLAALCASVCDVARAAGVSPAEIHLDFDCAESKLDGYRLWVRAIRAKSNVPIVITALPAWLKHESSFAALVREAGGFVLQVHSLRKPANIDDAASLCDIAEARTAIDRAAKVGVPFRVALPTHGYVLAFGPDGKYLGFGSEGPQHHWPEGTRLRELRADPSELATLVGELSRSHSPSLTGLIWYRLPTRQDTLNWPIETLTSVARGTVPIAQLRLDAVRADSGLLELSLTNTGTADAPVPDAAVNWSKGKLVAIDGLAGFTAERAPQQQNVTIRKPAGAMRVAPGQRIVIAWMRLDPIDTEVTTHVATTTP